MTALIPDWRYILLAALIALLVREWFILGWAGDVTERESTQERTEPLTEDRVVSSRVDQGVKSSPPPWPLASRSVTSQDRGPRGWEAHSRAFLSNRRRTGGSMPDTQEGIPGGRDTPLAAQTAGKTGAAASCGDTATNRTNGGTGQPYDWASEGDAA